MKILFVFGGLPHYYNAILNRLNKISGLDISVLIPTSKSKTIGKGVYQSKKDINFNVIELEEKLSFYKKPYFPKLFKIIMKEKPETIVYLIDEVR